MSQDNNTRNGSADAPKENVENNIFDVMRNNAIKMIDETARIQPQIAHSVSSFQIECLDSARSLIGSSFAGQKEFLSAINVSPFIQEISSQMANRSIVTIGDTIRSVNALNVLGASVLDLARENLKIYNRAVDAAMEYNTSLLKSWSNYWSPFA